MFDQRGGTDPSERMAEGSVRSKKRVMTKGREGWGSRNKWEGKPGLRNTPIANEDLFPSTDAERVICKKKKEGGKQRCRGGEKAEEPNPPPLQYSRPKLDPL